VSNHSALALSTTLILVITVYLAVFGTGISYVLKLVAQGPKEYAGGRPARDLDNTRRPARPLSAAPDVDPAAIPSDRGKE
jgi:cytochrome d ubiquinol oxidase subunit I